jgi:hypothetical protein
MYMVHEHTCINRGRDTITVHYNITYTIICITNYDEVQKRSRTGLELGSVLVSLSLLSYLNVRDRT